MKITAACIGVLFLLLVLFAWGTKAESKPASQPGKPPAPAANREPDYALVSGQVVEITGKVRLVGNMPFPQLVITDSENLDWHIDEGEKKTLAGFEQQTVKVRGTVELLEIRLADNQYMGVRRLLRHITLPEQDF
ncbi:MAG: hypothetical protein LBD55_02260 [Treponema sp.]|jgi:hypothetical protein|nr:hypothetical protein [Treponema sp.]